MIKQLAILDDENDSKLEINDYEITEFSHEKFAVDKERLSLEKRYIDLIEETNIFNRQLVSYQANKHESVHKWLKYREGFSSELVSILLQQFGAKEGELVLDPFMGSGTTALVAKMFGLNSIGFDILPISEIAFNAKKFIYNYKLDELNAIYAMIQGNEFTSEKVPSFNHLGITEGAFPDETEKDLMFLTNLINCSNYSLEAKNLLKLIFVNSLESISYTRKDGQYLRWDYRSKKVISGNKKRIEQGKEPLRTILDKGPLPSIKECVLTELSSIIRDIEIIQQNTEDKSNSETFIKGSSLYEIPKMEPDQINWVITSPPYCNRYDYTRTYALELAYLGVNEKSIKQLRQDLLTCTVESKPKLKQLEQYYKELDLTERYKEISEIVQSNKVLAEINEALSLRMKNGDMNNKGVLQMVDGYFTELAFVFYELYRTSKKGAKVAFVNDNVRYGGEVIPVDFLTTAIAEQIGFKAIKIYILKQRKGNSSQQMKKFGNVPLRKSITIWEK